MGADCKSVGVYLPRFESWICHPREPGPETGRALVPFGEVRSVRLVPVIACLPVLGKMAGPLDALKDWLTADNHALMSVLLLVLGVAVLGKALTYAG